MQTETFADLALAAYCPRKLYYRRRNDDWDVPEDVERRRELAHRYRELLATDAVDEALLEVPADEWRSNLERARDRAFWGAAVDPDARDVFLEGRDCRGIVHKVLDVDGPIPSVVATGGAPSDGVWETDSVRAVAAAKALAWERQQPVERAYVEYPAYGVVRPVAITTRRKALYQSAVRTAASLAAPPPRLENDAKCDACEYADTCGVRTRSLRSLLGFG